jgi:hypothetical protein
MLDGIEFPPVRVCFDGASYWLTDGFHRVAAAESLQRGAMRAQLFHGTATDAQWDSYCSNAHHGLRRTPEDLKRIIMRTLRHPKSAGLTNCEIARHLHVSEKTVRRFRWQVSSASAEDERVAMRNGREYKIHTANIGKTRKEESATAHATLERRLAADLLLMDREASPEVRRILRIFTGWTRRALQPLQVLHALENLMADLKTNRGFAQRR